MLSRRRFSAAAAMAAIGLKARAQTPAKVLRVVPQAEPLVFDPHQSQANVTSIHGAMVLACPP